MVICLERDADLHMAQLMPLLLTVSCFSKIQIGFIFLVPAYPGRPGKGAVKRVCVCVCCYIWSTHPGLPLSFYRPDALPVTQPTASKHALKAYAPVKDNPENHNFVI